MLPSALELKKIKIYRTLFHEVNECCVVVAILGPSDDKREDSADLSKLVVKISRFCSQSF